MSNRRLYVIISIIGGNDSVWFIGGGDEIMYIDNGIVSGRGLRVKVCCY